MNKYDYEQTVIDDFIEWADYEDDLAEVTYNTENDVWILAWYLNTHCGKCLEIFTFKTKLECAKWCFTELDVREFYNESEDDNRIRNEIFKSLYGVEY